MTNKKKIDLIERLSRQAEICHSLAEHLFETYFVNENTPLSDTALRIKNADDLNLNKKLCKALVGYGLKTFSSRIKRSLKREEFLEALKISESIFEKGILYMKQHGNEHLTEYKRNLITIQDAISEHLATPYESDYQERYDHDIGKHYEHTSIADLRKHLKQMEDRNPSLRFLKGGSKNEKGYRR